MNHATEALVDDRIASALRDAHEWSGDPEGDFTCIIPNEGTLRCVRNRPRGANPWYTVLTPF